MAFKVKHYNVDMIFICKFAHENVNVKRFSNTFPAL